LLTACLYNLAYIDTVFSTSHSVKGFFPGQPW